MSSIEQFLQSIRTAILARTVRNDIANAIEQCYDDVSNPTLKTEAIQAAVQAKIDAGEMAALTIGDGTLTGAKFADGTIPKAKLDPSITFDADPALDTTSTNAIQNKVVAQGFASINVSLGVLSKYSGKKISIIGDSIDTYNKAGYKIDGYNMYYPTLDVTSVDYTWWMQVISAVGATLEVNASFSGSRLTNTHSDPTYPSLYDRVLLIGNPDIIFITLGTNDSNAAVALGEYDYETPYEDLPENTFRGAYIKGIKALQALYPSAQIVCVTEKMGSTYKKEVAIIAQALGVDYVDASDYVAQSGSHPGKKGMVQIAKAVLNPTDKNLMFSGIPADGAAVGEVKSDLLAMSNLKLVDLSDKITVGTNNRYIGATSGGTGTDNDAYITGYVDISEYAKIRYSMFKTTMTASNVDAGMCFYDGNKTFIKGIKGIKSAAERGYVISTADVPDNAVYARFSAQKDSETYGEFVLEGMLPFIGTIDNLRNAIDEVRDATPLEMSSGYIATNTGIGTTVDFDAITESANFKHCITQCVGGDKFSLSGTGGISPRLWCFLDSDKTILSVSDASISATNLIITAPENAAYCIVQSNDSTKTSYKGVSLNIRVNELGAYIDEIPEIEDAAYALDEMPPVIKTNYDNNGNAHLRVLEGNTGITQLDIKRYGSRLTIDGHFVSTNADGYGYIGLNNPLRRTVTPSTVKTWTSNLSLKSGHAYVISLRQVAGTVTKETGAYVAISVYKQGTNSSVGTARGTKNGQIRYFIADDSKYNVVMFLCGELTFDNAVFEIILEDRWDYGFSPVANTSLLYKGADARGVQGGVLHDCMIYSYCYAGWHGLRKVDLRTGTQTEQEINLGHGNDMTWYNGKLYLVSMEDTGRIYIIDPDTLAVDSYVDFQMDDEVQRDNSGIAYDSKNNRFIIKTNNGFAFANTSLEFQSFVSREYLSGATGQGIETDGYYIYVMESYSGASGGRIDVYNFDGSWVDTILITKTGEPETLCYENGAWWYFNNIESPTSWEVCGIIINRQINMPALASYARYFGKV